MANVPTESQWQSIDPDIFASKKIQAIKSYRAATGTGLKEAKDAVEAREAALRQTSPEKFSAAAKTGCMVLIVLGAAATIAAAGIGVHLLHS